MKGTGNRPKLFTSAMVDRVVDNSYGHRTTMSDVVDSNIESSSSFRYESPGIGLKSTQQLNVDYSKFQNHTFFNSAEVNVNVAFDRIINNFPFDGSRKETEDFFDKLTGFDKWVYDKFPKNIGFLIFSASYIVVDDFAGTQFPLLSKKSTAENILDPVLKPITFEMHVFVPAEANDNEIIVQKLSGTRHGITLALSSSTSTGSCELHFGVVSASNGLVVSASINKGTFNHIAASFNRRPGINRLELYVNETLVEETSASTELGKIDFAVASFVIGSGSTIDYSNISETPGYASGIFTPQQTFSGALDELRVFHDIRTPEQQKQYAQKAIYASPDLKLYYKFNEPASASFNDPVSATSSTSKILLDSSGNSLHSIIVNYSNDLRLTASYASNPMIYEKRSQSPVLFPSYKDVMDLNIDLLYSASMYDIENPNLITKLVPKHYFLEGQVHQNLETEDGEIVQSYGSGSIAMPGDGRLGSAQILATLLYTWAKFFDELKLFLDSFSNLTHVGYDIEDTLPNQFLPQLLKRYGFDIPNFFQGSTIEQYLDGENILDETSTSLNPLNYIQNQIWRRILTNIQEIIRSKGTIHSVKSFIRSVGIDPDSNFRIKEYGGSTSRVLQEIRETRFDISNLLDFSLGSGSQNIISDLLSGSRFEIGYPSLRGTFVAHSSSIHGISNNAGDGLWTSGSWTYEGVYKYPTSASLSAFTQSLVRFCTTGSGLGVFLTPYIEPVGIVHANLLAMKATGISGSKNRLELIIGPHTRDELRLGFDDVDIFDGDRWHVSFGRYRADDDVLFLSTSVRSVSSSYFLRCAKPVSGEVVELYSTSSFFFEDPESSWCSNITPGYNDSGSFIMIGSQSLNTFDPAVGSFVHLQQTSTNIHEKETRFDGCVGHIRFWSKALAEDEWNEHVRNFKSLGVLDPTVNFNFVVDERSGSFERLRVDAEMDQLVTSSDSGGSIQIYDFSKNEKHLSGSNFYPSTPIFDHTLVQMSMISPRFDDVATSEKVRVRGFTDLTNVQKYGAEAAPIYELSPFETSNDDSRFSIDFSIISSLDEDIINMFAVLDELDNAIGNPELQYSEEYPALDNLRAIYFNRLTGKINIKGFFEFFKWFDDSIGMFIGQLLPRNTKYLGTNFIVESHMLERNKMSYPVSEIYVAQNVRTITSKKKSEQVSIALQDELFVRRMNELRLGFEFYVPIGLPLTRF